MGKLATLKDNRKEARDALAAFTDELEKILTGDKDNNIEARAWTPEEEAKLTSLRNRVTQLDTLISDAEDEKRQAEEQQEERERKLGGAGGIEGAPNEIRVGWEDTLVYSHANPDNSWYQDRLDAAVPGPRQPEALKRLFRHQEQMEGILNAGPAGKDAKGKAAYRAVRGYTREDRRLRGDTRQEVRAVSTGSSSMGDFAPTIYMLPEFAPYRTYGRVLIDSLKKFPLPETGLTFSVPVITQPTQGVNQTNSSTQGANENQTVTSRDMTAAYETGVLQTIIDNLNVSQQYLDRVGPGIDGDMIVHDDQTRQLNRTINIYAWNQLYAAALAASPVAAVLYTDTAFNAQKFKAQIHSAKATIRKTDGTVAYPTHGFFDADLWESIEGAYDSSGRPYVVPQGVAFNPLAVGEESGAPEGYTGFKFAGLPALSDEAMWVSWSGGAASGGSSTYHPGVIGALDIAAYWMEGAPVVRVLPQPGAATLTVLIQSYAYCAYVPIYPEAIQLIFGTGTQTGYLL